MSNLYKKALERKHTNAVKRAKNNKAVAHKNKLNKLKQSKLVSDKKNAHLLARKGVVKMAAELARVKNSNGDEKLELSNRDVMTGIMDLINTVSPLHGAVEVFSTLVNDKVLSCTDEQQTLIDEFDKQIVKLTEDISAITTLIEVANKEPEDYLDLLISHVDTAAIIVEQTIPSLMDDVFAEEATKSVLEAYVNEHKLEAENNFEFGLRHHNYRMSIIFPKYKTNLQREELIVNVADSEESVGNPLAC